MEFFADMHCHTKYSDGRNQVGEMIRAAAAKGLTRLAITDHGPNNIGTGVRNQATYQKIKNDIIANQVAGLEVFLGAEANVIDLKGRIDLSGQVLEQLDWLIIGLHPYAFPASLRAAVELIGANQLAKISSKVAVRVKDTNTKALTAAIHRYQPHCVSHPGLQMAVDLDQVATACLATGTLFEINTSHKYQQVEDIRLVAQQGVDFVVNSDSHYTATIGELAWGSRLLEEAGVASDKVYNAIH